MELGWKCKIIFNRIGWTHNFRVLAPDDSANQVHLHFKWQAGGKTVNIEFIGFYSLRLKEDLMPCSSPET